MKISNPQPNTGSMIRVAGIRLLPGESGAVPADNFTPHFCKVVLAQHNAEKAKIEFESAEEQGLFLTALGGSPSGEFAVLKTPKAAPKAAPKEQKEPKPKKAKGSKSEPPASLEEAPASSLPPAPGATPDLAGVVNLKT